MIAKIEMIRMEPKNTNSVLVSHNESAVIFDPWGYGTDWLKLLNERGLKLHSIYCTHGHFDHVSAIAQLPKVPWFLNPDDMKVLEWGNPILCEMGMPKIDLIKNPPQHLLAGEIEILPEIFATAVHCPGHSPGGMAFYFKSENTLIIGDTLFQESIGAYHFPGGNLQQLKESIANIYNMNLPDDTIVIHGHGIHTTIGWLKENNPFFHK